MLKAFARLCALSALAAGLGFGTAAEAKVKVAMQPSDNLTATFRILLTPFWARSARIAGLEACVTSAPPRLLFRPGGSSRRSRPHSEADRLWSVPS